jgi:hypothetical protein
MLGIPEWVIVAALIFDTVMSAVYLASIMRGHRP